MNISFGQNGTMDKAWRVCYYCSDMQMICKWYAEHGASVYVDQKFLIAHILARFFSAQFNEFLTITPFRLILIQVYFIRLWKNRIGWWEESFEEEYDQRKSKTTNQWNEMNNDAWLMMEKWIDQRAN